MRTDSNPPDINRFRMKTGKHFILSKNVRKLYAPNHKIFKLHVLRVLSLVRLKLVDSKVKPGFDLDAA